MTKKGAASTDVTCLEGVVMALIRMVRALIESGGVRSLRMRLFVKIPSLAV